MRYCCRCQKLVENEVHVMGGMTAGYYDVRGNAWEQFSNPGEDFICDACMWSDPRYIAVYGIVK
jgi:hypothetical protein